MANAAAFLNHGPTMDWTTDDGLYARYKTWRQRCQLLFTGPMSKVEEEIKCKYLLYWAGERGLDLFNSWNVSEADQKLLATYWSGFENFVKPQSNELMAAWELHHAKQDNLSLEEFIANLRTLVKEANFPEGQHDRFLRDFLVFGMASDHARKECFKEGNALTLEKALALARAEESAEMQLKRITKPVEVHAVRKQPQGNPNEPNCGHCSYCGGNLHPRERCPARNAKCHSCSKTGHFAKACLSSKQGTQRKQGAQRRVHVVETDEGTPPDNAFQTVFLGPIEATPLYTSVNAISCKDKALLELQLSPKPVGEYTPMLCKIDSGAETNILPKSVYEQMYPQQHKLDKATVKLSAYGGTEITNIGSCDVYIQGPGDHTISSIHMEVADADGPTIIGNKTAQKLNLLKLNWPIQAEPGIPTSKGEAAMSSQEDRQAVSEQHKVKLFDIQGKQHPFPLTKDYLLSEYADVFTGIGCFPGPPHHIEIDPDVPPIQHAPRQVPIHLQPAYREELQHLTEAGILCEVHNEYTPWVSSTVVTMKANGKIRLCLDPRDLNKAIKRNPYYVRTIDDVIPKVSGATHFSILDARSGFWQVKLDEQSSRLCTFNTPWGKYRWTRLPFGLSCSGDVFQEKMDTVFGQIEGLSGIADDTFVYGSTEPQHDQHTLDVLDAARTNNVRFNPDKFQFKVGEASFFGLTWSPDGVRPDAKKVKAIADMPPPKNLTELQTFMGMVNYLNRFSPALAQTSQPIRQLLKKDTPFVWQPEQQKAFQEMKCIITEAPVLTYYDPEKETVIQSDASLKGLGCVLLQGGKPVSYASRSLTDAESRYSNIERELLAACWSLEKHNHYVYGKKVVVETDLLDYKGAQYLVVTDYYSKFPVLRKMTSTTSAAVINHLKSIFAEYGIPEILISDNGPQYSSHEFATFCDQWGISHVTSSPLYPRSNGCVERMVQTLKALLKKAEASGQDPYLALLSHRTTPVDTKLPAPATLLNHREYRTQLPCSGRIQRSQTNESDHQQLIHRQTEQKYHHDKKASRTLSELQPRQAVGVYHPQSKTWLPAHVEEKTNEPRSYIVKLPSGSELRRNRSQLKPADTTEESPPTLPSTLPSPQMQVPPMQLTVGSTNTTTTRSGRIIKPPDKLDL